MFGFWLLYADYDALGGGLCLDFLRVCCWGWLCCLWFIDFSMLRVGVSVVWLWMFGFVGLFVERGWFACLFWFGCCFLLFVCVVVWRLAFDYLLLCGLCLCLVLVINGCVCARGLFDYMVCALFAGRVITVVRFVGLWCWI